jgi:hypothetical protein
VDGRLTAPAIIHYGFCESKSSMQDKNAYYVTRGEETTRPATTAFRAAALTGETPEGCWVQPYRGFLPYRPISHLSFSHEFVETSRDYSSDTQSIETRRPISIMDQATELEIR